MDIRKIQRTGDMNYLYLPTSWCKEYGVSSSSSVSLTRGAGGSLIVTPKIMKKKPKHVELNISGNNVEVINKIVMACYINPTDSFKIHLEKALDYRELLNQKRLVSVELVEVEDNGKTITCESSVTVGDPDMLLRTMVNKIKNMLVVMTQNPNDELVQKYEEEIDRNRIMVDKSVISAMTYNTESKLRTVDLFYTALIAKDLERLADHIIVIDEKEKDFLKDVLEVVRSLKDVIDLATEPRKDQNGLDYQSAVNFAEKAIALKEGKAKGIESYHKVRIRHYLLNISDVLIDWAVTNKSE
ncbi:MAG TPA: hypothetical protein VJC00_04900 [Candidatus Nanoarchaeia archaeon]|nr:hypothetical protein [Candidatus Nanoarchaeia archaeon]